MFDSVYNILRYLFGVCEQRTLYKSCWWFFSCVLPGFPIVRIGVSCRCSFHFWQLIIREWIASPVHRNPRVMGCINLNPKPSLRKNSSPTKALRFWHPNNSPKLAQSSMTRKHDVNQISKHMKRTPLDQALNLNCWMLVELVQLFHTMKKILKTSSTRKAECSKKCLHLHGKSCEYRKKHVERLRAGPSMPRSFSSSRYLQLCQLGPNKWWALPSLSWSLPSPELLNTWIQSPAGKTMS